MVGGLKVWDEECGVLHRELEGGGQFVGALATFVSPDGQQPRLAAASAVGDLWVYDPEAGSVLPRLQGHTKRINDLACIASSSAAPHHPRLVSASQNGTARVWDGETGEMLTILSHEKPVKSVAVWKEHTGGHDRIATSGYDRRVRVWDGEAVTLLHDLDSTFRRLMTLQSAEGPHRLLVVAKNQACRCGLDCKCSSPLRIHTKMAVCGD
jgi:WD40 repeat protein